MEVVVVLFFFGLSAGAVGKIKGSSFLIWFLVGAVLPVFGTLAALFYRYERNEPRRECDECGRIMPVTDQVCRGCGADQGLPSRLLVKPS
jgi:membrane protein implicated in regulation of membrane protease activity